MKLRYLPLVPPTDEDARGSDTDNSTKTKFKSASDTEDGNPADYDCIGES